MSERAAYSRVYWSIVDDDKFASVYDDDHHLGAWLRLLLIADQAHPASAHLPANVRRASVRVLAEVELIDLLPGGRYRVHGLDAERERRRLAATSRPTKGPKSGPDGSRSVTERYPNGSGTTGLRRDETRQDETSRADARPTDQWDDPEFPVLSYLASVRATVQPTGNGYHRELVALVERQGADKVVAAMQRRHAAGDRSARQLIYGAANDLEPVHRGKAAESKGHHAQDVEEVERAFAGR